ncbi:MAG: hypothetical protein ACPL3P_03040 [Anaerolineales bacterium]
MDQKQYLPNLNQLSTIVAAILLAYAISRLSNITIQEFRFQLLGFIFIFNLNLQFITIPLVAGLAASGADWLIHSHPHWAGGVSIQHWLIPLLTAFVLGFPIIQLPYGASWWLTFLVGAIILMAILVAEFISVDPQDIRQPLASSILIAIAYALYFIFCLAIYLFSYRLIFSLPAITIAAFLVSLRTLKLLKPSHWAFQEAAIIALIAGQFSAALHYWPLSPISYSLALLGPTYALFLFSSRMNQASKLRTRLLEPGMIVLIFWSIAYWLK